MKINTKIFLVFLLTIVITGVAYAVLVLPTFVIDELNMVVLSLGNQVDELDSVLGKYQEMQEEDLRAIIVNYSLDTIAALETDEEASGIFSSILYANPQIHAIYLVRPDGTTLAADTASGSRLLKEDYRKQSWYRYAVDHPGRLSFSNLEQKQDSADLTLYGAVALTGRDVTQRNVLAFELDASLLQEFLKGMNFRDTGIYGINMGLESLIVEAGKPLRIETDSAIEAQIHKGIELEGGQGIGELEYNGIPYNIAVRKSETTPWTYFFMVNDTELESLVLGRILPLAGISGGMTLAALVVLLLLLRFLVNKPLVDMSRVMVYIADTVDLSRTVEVKRRDEIGRMAEAFNKMLAELRNQRENLEVIVSDRTRELQKMMVAIEQSPSEIMITDRNSRIEYVNVKAVTDSGYTSEELLGMDQSQLLDSDNDFEVLEDMRRTLRSGRAWEGDLVCLRKNGMRVWERVLIAPVFDEHQQVMNYISVSSDITRQKEAQKELETAKRDAEAAARAKSDFLANMSHEIRTPMNAIIGLNSLLEATALTDRQQDYVGKIGRSAENLLGIINDILDFSKIEAGKLNVEHVEFSLDEVVENLSGVIGMKAFDSGLEFVVDRDPEIPEWLVGDPLRLGQILMNLAGNAVKFTLRGEILLRIVEAGREGDVSNVRFEVRDTGIGMTEEQLGRLFKAFSQADTSTTRRFGGTGLGLAISKDLVSMMGGTLEVESAEGQGSRFWFTIPLTLGSTRSKSMASLPEVLRDLRIAVIDDNESAREVFISSLSDFRHPPEVFSGGSEALTHYRENPLPDLVLMDYRMEGLNGIDTWMKLTNDVPVQERPDIILITAFGREDVLKEAQRAGIEKVLMKPVLKSQLIAAIISRYAPEAESGRQASREGGLDPSPAILGASVLLVEDNEINQQVAREMLESKGFKVVVADNGALALDILAQESGFDIVLMDLQMPVMDGYTAAERIRELYGATALPIIALSADVLEGVVDKVKASGMQDHLAKPIQPKALMEALERWIQPGEREPAPLKSGEVMPAGDLERLKTILEPLDVEEGLDRFSGNVTEYRKMLYRFAETGRTLLEDFLSAMKTGDRQRGLREIHTLKGVSGNIGAKALYETAKTVEQEAVQLEDSEESLEGRRSVGLLETELERVLSAIRTLGETEADTTSDPGTPVPVLDKGQMVEALLSLGQLLEDFDTEAEEAASRLTGSLEALGYSAAWGSILKAIGQYEFNTAHEALQALLGSIGQE